ncbi:hypothetical protein LOCC1_G005895 [Lachnellula occidentalis]|uniref:2EXR domain-containing protein n=1 Tax=Lachnellula occidentalis TaxID=215460 RepID=A0A8H8UC57_9HELO|nr:hypothetical protein LOCC1_G005895 [Lachnellula occidentalis]
MVPLTTRTPSPRLYTLHFKEASPQIKGQSLRHKMSSSFDDPQSRTFAAFPRLPIELRFKIWENASMATRTLELWYSFDNQRFSTFQPVPAVLHTCREARRAGNRMYSLSFGSAKSPPRTYFNPICDIIYFGLRVYDDEVDFMLRFFRRHADSFEDEDQIQRLALTEHLWRIDLEGSVFAPLRSGRTGRKIVKFHQSFPHLKELIFVAGQDGCEGDEEVEGRWETNAGVSLVKRQTNLAAGFQLTQEAVVSTFELRKKEFPDEVFPEITLMEYGYGA